MSQQLSTNTFGVAKWVVSADATQGTHTTITAATTSASSGDTIFLRDLSFTEDVAMKAGVSYVALAGAAGEPTTTVTGKWTFSSAGTVSLSNIRMTTNSDFVLAVTGSAASIVNLNNCYLNCSNNTGISFTSSNASAQINLNNCQGNIGTTLIALFASSSAGSIGFNYCNFSNSGGSSTASTISAGTFSSNYSAFASPLTTSGTAAASSIYGSYSGAAQNATALTAGGSGTHAFQKCRFASGTASAVSISSSCTLTDCVIVSSNTNAITGAGTLTYNNLSFASSSSNINTTTQTVAVVGPSVTIGSTNSGNTNTLTVLNSSNTASSAANIVSSVAGSTAADATFQATTTATTWTWGADNSVTSPTADPFVIAQGTTLGTNNIMSAATSGEINWPLQPAFLATLGTGDTDKTGAGSSYTLGSGNALTVIFDQNSDFNTNGTFTAPVTGRYYLNSSIGVTQITTAMTLGSYSIVTSNRTYQSHVGNVGAMMASTTTYNCSSSTICDMDAADTATTTVVFSNGAGNTADILATTGGTERSYFSGYLLC